MSKSKDKKVVRTTVSAKKSRSTAKSSTVKSILTTSQPLLFNKTNYIFFAAATGLIVLGLILMAGGRPDPNNFDPDLIYSFRRITLAPMVIVAGLIVAAVGIFKK